MWRTIFLSLPWLRILTVLAVVGVSLLGVHQYSEKKEEAAALQVQLDVANADLALARKAREAADEAAESHKRKNREARRQANAYYEELQKISWGCLDAPLPAELDELLWGISHQGDVKGRLSDAAIRLLTRKSRRGVEERRDDARRASDVDRRPQGTAGQQR